MSSLSRYVTESVDLTNQLAAEIEQLEAQLAELKEQLRVQSQIKKARETLETKASQQLKQLSELGYELLQVFPAEAVTELVGQIQSVATEAREDARDSLSLVPAQEEEKKIIEVDFTDSSREESMNLKEIEERIQDIDELVFQEFKGLLGIPRSIKKKSTIARRIFQKRITLFNFGNILSEAISKIERIVPR